MLLSRFWYLFLAVAAAAACAAAMLAQSVINARSDEALADSLGRDRLMVDALLRLEARARLDRMAFITVDGKLGGLLRQAQGVNDEKRLREISVNVKEAMRGHVGKMIEAAAGEGSTEDKRAEVQPDIAFALDADGRIIGQLGPLEANPPGASLATFPLVRRALQGYLRDDVWIYDRRVYRAAARPVMYGSEYAGAIVHGYQLDKGLPEKIGAKLPGATVAFFHGTDVLGSQIGAGAGAPQRAELASALPPILASSKFQAGERSEVIALQGGGRALFSPITGSAAASGVGYAVARPRKVLTSPDQLFHEASQDEVSALPLPILGGGALGLALIGLLFLYLERDRHLTALLKKTQEISAGQRDRLIVTEWRGAYRKLADRINQAIDKEVEKAGASAPATRKKANLDEILGPTPEASDMPFFGFASDDGAKASAAPSPVPAAPKAAAASAPRPPAPVSPPPQAATAHPATPARPSPAAAPPPPPSAAHAESSSDNGAGFDEDAHWHEVYEQYVATRKQCGEPIDNLTFDKFGVTLKKTRDQIVEKHGAKAVRFSVQVKEGKASLKAQPVKR